MFVFPEIIANDGREDSKRDLSVDPESLVAASLNSTRAKWRCRAYIFPVVKTFRLTFLRMRNKCKIVNIQRNDKALSV